MTVATNRMTSAKELKKLTEQTKSLADIRARIRDLPNTVSRVDELEDLVFEMSKFIVETHK